jgi:hypothetical protein
MCYVVQLTASSQTEPMVGEFEKLYEQCEKEIGDQLMKRTPV